MNDIKPKKPNKCKVLSFFTSLLHSSFIGILSLLYTVNYLDENLLKIRNYYFVSVFYFVFDYILVLIAYDLKHKIVLAIHHTISLYVLYVFISMKDEELSKVIVQAFTSEIPLIFFNINWFMIKSNMANTKLFKISDTLLLINYFLFRVCNFSYIIYYYYAKFEIISKLFLIIYTLSVYWFFVICKLYYRKNIKLKNN